MGRFVFASPALCLTLIKRVAWMAALLTLLSLHTTFAQTAASSSTTAKPTVAVLRFESAGASAVEASTATDRFQEELFNTGKFTLVDRAQVDHVLDEQVLQQSVCTTTACAVKVGHVVGAAQLVAGKVSKLDDKHWVVSGQLVDVETGRSLRVGSVQYEGAFFDLLKEGIPVLAARLADTPAPQIKGSLASRLIEMVNPLPVLDALVSNETKPGEPPPNAPKRGFSLFTGYTNHSGKVHLSSGGTANFSGGGFPNLGLDYQWVPGDRISLGAYLAVGGGSMSGDLSPFYDSLSSSEFGLELRYWTGRRFVGAKVASWGLGFFDDNSRGNDVLEFSGTSFGVTAGYEWDGGWYVAGAFDYATGTAETVQARTSTTTPRVPIGGSIESYGVWLNTGYRWK